MALYVLFTTLTTEGRRTIKQNPGRIWEVNKEIEKMGAKIISQYKVLGPYDFINIVEAPSNEVISRVALDIGSRGASQPTIMAATTIEAFVKEIEMAKAIDQKR
jgi:uncharacterized protein with GYD domain